MFGKIIKNLLFFLIAIILLIIVFRNHILKFFIENYTSRSLKAECKLKNANLWLGFLSLDELIVKTVDYDLVAKNITIKFKTQKEKPFFYINGVNLSDVTLKVKSLKSPKNIPDKKKTVISVPVLAKPVTLDLKNINIGVEDKSLEINSNFSVIAEIGQAVISIKDASIVDLDIRSQDFEMTNLRLKKLTNNGYLIKIPSIRVKDKTFNDFVMPVKARVNQLLFPRAKNPFLGPDGFMSARCDFKGYDNLCFAAKFKDASFEKIVDIFASEEAAFKGLFDGSLKTCLSAFKISEVTADFTNKGTGFINIKKESSLAFLRSYLDAPSYNALIDNFRNYEYNIGVIRARKEADVLSLNLDFTSDTMGKRNITINFHNTLGGI
jgi:hypothetical protein